MAAGSGPDVLDAGVVAGHHASWLNPEFAFDRYGGILY